MDLMDNLYKKAIFKQRPSPAECYDTTKIS